MLAVEPEGLPPAELGDLLRRAGRVCARTDAFRARVISEAERAGAAEALGFRSTAEWLAAVTGEPVPVARCQVAVAEALEQMPEARKALAAGEVSTSKVRLLAQAQALAPEQFARDEARLVAEVAAASPQQAPRLLAAWKRETDPEAAQAQVERLHQMRGLHVSARWDDMVHLSGDLDPEGGLVLLQALRGLADPVSLDPADGRTPAQARADALVEICRRHLDGGTGMSQPPRLQVTIPWDKLRSGCGLVDTEAGPITAETARRLACDATISRVILDAGSVPIDVGRASRVIPKALRKALNLRDRHCTHPGCDYPAGWCDAHHIVHWADGGRTKLANLRLLCRKHHREEHHQQPYPRRE